MFDGTLRSDKDKWKNFLDQVKAQFEDNVDGLALNVIDLVFFPICISGHFYVAVFSITKTTSMTILDNSDCGASYDSKYKDVCELLKKLFALHLKLYGHKWHDRIAKVNAKIATLKWKRKANFQDCGIFSMLHIESFNGGYAATWDSGLVAESKLQ
ncbi:ulp1 protease family, C-terminal catalytic domain-containing protein [Tanacetum coccineum]